MSRRRRAPLALALALTLPGCFALGRGAPTEVREYHLVPATAAAPRSLAPVTTRATLEVEAFGVSEALAGEGLAWRRGDVEVGAYADHRWARPPQQAVREVVAAELARALPSLAVSTEPRAESPELVLRAYVSHCEEVDRGERWFGAIELRVALVGRDGRELLRRTYAGEEPARARNPLGVVAALRVVALRLGDEVARDVAAALSRVEVSDERP